MNRTLKTPHPGEHLKELLSDLGVSNYRLAKASGLSATAIGQIISGHRRITAETAMRLGAALNMTPQFWLNAQTHYDLALARREAGAAVADIVPVVPALVAA
ncbi:MAG: HigA family addiction module antitoxin [Candidatus Spyradosoma sp.]